MKCIFTIRLSLFSNVSSADRRLKFLGKPAATPNVPGSKSGSSILGSTSSSAQTGRRDVPGSFLGRTCRPRRSEFSVVFFETRVNTFKDPLERPPRRALHTQASVPCETIGLNTNCQPTTNVTSRNYSIWKHFLLPVSEVLACFDAPYVLFYCFGKTSV